MVCSDARLRRSPGRIANIIVVSRNSKAMAETALSRRAEPKTASVFCDSGGDALRNNEGNYT